MLYLCWLEEDKPENAVLIEERTLASAAQELARRCYPSVATECFVLVAKVRYGNGESKTVKYRVEPRMVYIAFESNQFKE